MKRIFPQLLVLLLATHLVGAQIHNSALIFHTDNMAQLSFLDDQAKAIKDDLLFIYAFSVSPYRNYNAQNFANSVTTQCAIDTTQLIIYVAGATVTDENDEMYAMLYGADSTNYGRMLSFKRIASLLQGCKSRNLMLILDLPNAAKGIEPFVKDLGTDALFPSDGSKTPAAYVTEKSNLKARIVIANASMSYEPQGRYTNFSSKLMEAFRNFGGSDGFLHLNEIKGYMENLSDPPLIGALDGHQAGSDILLISR